MWNQIQTKERDKFNKWELKVQNVVLATITEKPTNGKYSVYFSTPKLFKEFNEQFLTHQFDTFEEAQKQCDEILYKDAYPWVSAVYEYMQVLDFISLHQ